jgi:phosphoribosyl-AMP cyclohydrolase
MEINFAKLDGLLPAIVQDDASGDVLMLGFMNRAALDTTLRTGTVTFYSRSRQCLWVKGERSGHRLVLRKLFVDCDADTLLLRVVPQGPGVCHEGYRSCFFRALNAAGQVEMTAKKSFDPATAYAQGEAR